MNEIQVFHVAPSIPEPIRFLEQLSQNLWWCWNHEAVQMFRRIDPAAWRESEHNAVEFLNRVPRAALEAVAQDKSFLDHLERIRAKFDAHMADVACPKPGEAAACYAYFSLEFGLHESLRIYSGGLGVLAGDHLKTAADCGLPLAAVGLFYHQGYFQQFLDDDGWQQEHYPEDPITDLPLRRALNPEGEPVSLSIPLPDGPISIAVWRLDVGRVPLFALDTNLPDNRPEYRWVTARLYGGDKLNRLRQELVLGIGGYRALVALGYAPEVCHLNEGHAAFLSLARMEHLMKTHGLDVATAFEVASRTNIFTTHTPVPAGNETFQLDLLEPHLDALEPEIGIAKDQVLAWGRFHGQTGGELSMTVLGLSFAQRANAVSALHGKVAREMWRHLWPGHATEEIPIGHVTNGVHVSTWMSAENIALFDRYLGTNWERNFASPELPEKIRGIPDEEIWRAHEVARTRLIRVARGGLERQNARRGATAAELREWRSMLDHEVLTVGFARRSAEYKRSNLLLSDPDRLARLLHDAERPIQFVFAGKAHPADEPGKRMIQQIVHETRREDLRHRIVFLENYDIRMARFLVQGVDVWLNTPRRYHEASGTSGMKAALNGVIHASILDGWWDEGFEDGRGWAIGADDAFDDQSYQDQLEARALYSLLEDKIVPCFYDRAAGGEPMEWIRMMKASMAMALGQFSSRRMVEEYRADYYEPAAADFRRLMAGNGALAESLVAMRRRVEGAWPKVRVAQPCVDRDMSALHVDDSFSVRTLVFLGDLATDDVDVEICHGRVGSQNVIRDGRFVKMTPVGEPVDGWLAFSGQVRCNDSGRHGFTTRAVASEANLKNVMPGLVTWADGTGSSETPTALEPVACAISPASL